MKKKIIAAVLSSVALITSAAAVDLYVDTVKLATDTPPTVVSGRTLVPVRQIFESLGAAVSWDPATRTATGVKGDTTVIIQIDSPTAYINGEAKLLDVPAQIINGRTMVPARFVSDALNCDVTWYQESQTAAVANKLKGQKLYVTSTGEKYHFDGGCNGGTYYEASLAEAMGRKLLPCAKCAGGKVPDPSSTPAPSTPPVTSTPANTATPSSSGNSNNFNTYDVPEQQQTNQSYVLNTKTKKFHYPSCKDVKRIKPANYATSSEARQSIVSKGYSSCGHCHP